MRVGCLWEEIVVGVDEVGVVDDDVCGDGFAGRQNDSSCSALVGGKGDVRDGC